MRYIPSGTRVFVATAAVDMRKSFDGLAGLVRNSFSCDPLDGSLYVFLSRRRDYVKILSFDGDGFWVWSKRLERGTFRKMSSASSGKDHIEVAGYELMMILEGLDYRGIRRRPRYNCVDVKKVNSGFEGRA